MLPRRQILRRSAITLPIALAAPLAGCLEDRNAIPGSADGNPITPASDRNGSSESDDPDCGPANRSLSELLADDAGDPAHCFDGARPSFAVENECGEPVTVGVDLDAGGGFAGTYALESGERAVEANAFEAESEIAGTVTIDGDDGTEEEWSVKWPQRSCHRYGVAILEDGVAIGWIEPLQGPGDTQHDCYPGTEIPIEIGSAGAERRVTATIRDRCAETETKTTVDIDADGHERIDGELVSGGVYDVTIDVDGGESLSETFREVCWGVSAHVDEDGTIRLDQLSID